MKWMWDFKWGRVKSDESGYIMVMAIFVLVVTSIIAVGLAVVGANEYQLSARTRLMDTAYQIAEAGISRACVQIKDNPSIVLTTGSGANNYMQPGDTWQWRSGFSPNYTEDLGTTGWGDSKYSVSIWQSELVPDNPYYKVLISTGSATRGGKTAERTIEARIIAGPSNTDYDSSFDYCIYNGFYGVGKPGDAGYEAPTENGVWPQAGTNYWLGQMTIDGVTENNGHKPKGAIYTKGNINIPSQGLSSCIIHGNIVATKNITLSSTWNSTLLTGIGIQVDNKDSFGVAQAGQGNVIAGLSGTGNAELDMYNNVSSNYTNGLNVTGYVVAPNNVKIDCRNNNNIGNSDNASISTGGIIAGGDLIVTRSGTTYAQRGLSLGNVFCAGEANIVSNFAGSISFTKLSAGGTPIGVHLENQRGGVTGPNGVGSSGAIYSEGKVEMVVSSANSYKVGDIHVGSPGAESVNIKADSGSFTTGVITAQGGVTISSTGSISPTVGSIFAGIDNTSNPVGNGIKVSLTAGNWLPSGGSSSITALGSVTLNVVSASSIDQIWSGSDANVTIGGLAGNLSVGAISARGDVTFTGGIVLFGTIWVGRISAENDVTISYYFGIAAGFNVAGIKAGGNATVSVSGWIGGNLTANNLDPWNDGPGTPDTPWPLTPPAQQDPLNDSIDAGGNISLSASGLWVSMNVNNNARAGGTITTNPSVVDIAGLTDPLNSDLSSPAFKPGVDVPMFHNPPPPNIIPDPDPTSLTLPIPASPWTYGPPTSDDYPSSLAYSAPAVDHDMILKKMAGLDSPVQLLEPNWAYFQEQAQIDEGKICPRCGKTNPRGSTECQFCHQDLTGVADKPPHVLVDNGPGDNNPATGTILFKWDASTAGSYSSNETIYQGSPDVTIVVDVKWSGVAPATFTGTLVTKGPIKITNDQGLGWVFVSGQTLNLISGKTISKNSTGFTLLQVDNLTYHWWARWNIDLTSMTFALVTAVNFQGSFTAGNRLIYDVSAPTAFWKIQNWKWTRWALDARAWLPPFTVLSYKEI